MLDHEEQFLFKEEILHMATALADGGLLDNVEDLLTDVIPSPRFDSDVFTLERSLQVMLGSRAGSTLVGLLTVPPGGVDAGGEGRPPHAGPVAATTTSPPSPPPTPTASSAWPPRSWGGLASISSPRWSSRSWWRAFE